MLGLLLLALAVVEAGLLDAARPSLAGNRWQPDELVLLSGAVLACLAWLTYPARPASSDAGANQPAGMEWPVEDRDQAKRDATLIRDLRAAIAADALEVHYQPKMDARSSRIVSLEALVRWRDAKGDSISPARFIPLAERSGDIRALTLRVLERTCWDYRYLAANGQDQPVYVNISAQLVSDTTFVDQLIATVRAAKVRLGIEVTETAVLEDPERALANLDRIAAAGIAIAIDDYGVGLSSLTYLRRMPASELKIDMSFIRDLSDSHRDPLIVRSTVDLAHGLGMKVTAEGVDKPETMALLRVMGCDFVQGYQIAPALKREACLAFLRDDASIDQSLPEFATALARFARPNV